MVRDSARPLLGPWGRRRTSSARERFDVQLCELDLLPRERRISFKDLLDRGTLVKHIGYCMDWDPGAPINRSAEHDFRVRIHGALGFSQLVQPSLDFLPRRFDFDQDDTSFRNCDYVKARVALDGSRNLTSSRKRKRSQTSGFQTQKKDLWLGQQPGNGIPFTNTSGPDELVLNCFVYRR